MRKLWPGLVAIALAAAFGLMNLGKLPPELPTHWNFQGEPDSWTRSGIAVFLAPALGLALAMILSVLPKFDPRRANFPQYEGTWWIIGNVVLVFLALVHVVVIGNGLGWAIPMPMVIGLSVGALFVVLGNYITRVRPNWFLGIRTPWTLSSERAWRETHRVGGTLFVLGGLVLIAVTLITRKPSFWALLLCGVGPGIVSVIYSYFAWRRDTSRPVEQQ